VLTPHRHSVYRERQPAQPSIAPASDDT
jgi:hypothetical protein